MFLLKNQTLHILAKLQTPGLENLRAATHAGLLENWTVTFVLERSDGSEIVYQTGSASQVHLAFWRLKPNGSREQLLANNDSLPGGTKPVALATATTQVFIEEGTVYLALSSPTSERTPERVLVRHRNGQFAPLLIGNSVQNGIGGIAVTTFALGSVQSGELLVTATLAGGRAGVFHWNAGLWTKLFSRESTFDGEAPQSFTLFPAGHQGDSLVVQVAFPAGRNTVRRLYSNLVDSTPPPPPPRLVLERLNAGAALLRIQGAAVTRHRLVHSTNLLTWTEYFTMETSPAGTAEQTIPIPDAEGFFRADAVEQQDAIKATCSTRTPSKPSRTRGWEGKDNLHTPQFPFLHSGLPNTPRLPAYARIGFTSSPWTSVRRKSRPWKR